MAVQLISIECAQMRVSARIPRLPKVVSDSNLSSEQPTGPEYSTVPPYSTAQRNRASKSLKVVARDGIEPSTRGFSVRCSTN